MKKIRSAYTPRPVVYNPVSGEPSRVKQEFKKEVNINEIVARMRRGISPPPWMTSATPQYGDFSDLPATFMEAHAIVERAHDAFMSLPLEFRRALDHDPRNLDKAPRELYEQFGLVKKNSAPNSPSSQPEGLPPGQPTGGPDGSSEPPKAHSSANKGSKKPAQNADE